MQLRQITDTKVPLPAEHIPFHGFDQDLSYVVAGILKQRQFVQGCVPGSRPDPGVDVSNLKTNVRLGINLVYSDLKFSIYQVNTRKI